MISVDPENGDIVFSGFTEGIGVSPHKGLGNLQNVNLNTANGEALISLQRVQDSMTETTATGSLSYLSTDHVNLSIPNTNNLFKGQWITVTNSSNTMQLPNGTYYVPPSAGAGFELSNFYNVLSYTLPVTVNYTIVAGGAGGGHGDSSGGGGGGGGGGQVKTGTASLTAQAYTVTVGTGGSAASNGVASSAFSVSSSGGVAGANSSGGTSGTGGASGNGHAGGAAAGSGGGGGGGDSIIGSAGAGNGGGLGGNGTSSNTVGASFTYGGGGGGGGGSGGGGAAGGTGGGGTGGSSSPAATPGIANTGGGGGGGFDNTAGAAGGSGIVEINYPTGSIIGATGGTITIVIIGGVSRTVHTFKSSGMFTIPAPPVTILSGFTAGLTATIQLLRVMGLPIAQATETYVANGTVYHRYYILDNQNLVWVYDDQNETLFSSSDNVAWFLPDFHTDWCVSASGIGIISGTLVGTTSDGILGKSTSILGNTNSSSTTWTQFNSMAGWEGSASSTTIPHFAYTGHQNILYISDAAYIASIFPDSTLANTSSTKDDVQTLCSWVPDVVSSQFLGDYSIIDGTSPATADSLYLPVVFFTEPGGSLPSTLSTGTVYYIKTFVDNNQFEVVYDPTIPDSQTLTLSGSTSAGDVSASLTANWTFPTGLYTVTFSDSEVRQVNFTKSSEGITWNLPLTGNSSTTITVSGFLDIQTGVVGTQYFNSFWPFAAATTYSGTTPTFAFSPQRVSLPVFEISQCMTEIGNYIIIGCQGNTLYPWDQAASKASNIIALPESDVRTILTVNQMAYVFAGNKGNVYITDGSVASFVTSVPDYCAGIPGSPETYIEPYFTWKSSMYLRGRVYFSILDQTSTKAGNCGGVWSFIPTQNFYVGQDVGISLRLENQNSYGTYNGAAPILIPKFNQKAVSPQYFSGWFSDLTTPTYGIDTTGLMPVASAILETELIPTGTILGQQKKTFTSEEYKLSSPLLSGESVQLNYRLNLTDAWATCGTVNTDSANISGYFPVNFQNSQWVQFQALMTPNGTSTFSGNRLTEIRLHPSKYESN